jgi:calcineurin-like phosphoesterase family protein
MDEGDPRLSTEEHRDGARGATTEPSAGSSRDSLAGAGWRCREVGVSPSGGPPFSWINPLPMWRSRNQILGHILGDPTNDERRLWMKMQREARQLPENLIIDQHAGLEEVSFLVVGDPGEGDASQYAVVKPLLVRGDGTDFMVVLSDVIYPSGDAEDYDAKFYRAYEDYPRPIYALPGNHDWYDGLVGFMYHLCGAEVSALPATEERASSLKERLRRRLWRRPARRSAEKLPERQRTQEGRRSSQRSPYFAIETGPLLLVGIDTGMGGEMDREQGEWLRKISREVDKPKVLLTGKPIYVDNEYNRGPIEGGGTVDEIVRAPEHNYVAAIGGDIHNYQRYRVKVGGREAPLYYIVSGGGGAYMSATHRIPKVDLEGVTEDDFVCYPRRGDSLSFYSKLYDRRLAFGRGWLEIAPDEAAAYMARRLGIEPARPGDRRIYVGRRVRRVAEWIFPLPGRGRGPIHHFFSEFFDWNRPPLFKNFLRIDASREEVRIRCFAATGCAEHQDNPPVEDEVRIPLR